MKWKDSLRKWRQERGLTKPQDNTNKETGNPAIVDMLLEEVDELKKAILEGDTHEIIDALADTIVLSSNHIGQLKYDLDLVMKEVFKEISSRRGSINPKTGKWEKDKSQDPKTLYKANYGTCKVKS